MSTLKQRARAAVKVAIGRGALTRPDRCFECGSADKPGSDGRTTIHAHHHKGYEAALDVQWLCVKCHFKRDKRPSGVSNGRSKLTLAQVEEIRARYRPGVNRWHNAGGAKPLAREYGITDRTIRRIVSGNTWQDAALSANDGKGEGK